MPTPDAEDAAVQRASELAARIKPLMAGQGSDVQGAVLVELVALHLAGHAPMERAYLLAIHLQSVREMIPVMEQEIFGPAGHPGRSS